MLAILRDLQVRVIFIKKETPLLTLHTEVTVADHI